MSDPLETSFAADESCLLIPLTKLYPSKSNARRTDRNADIEALAEDIAAHGILQNLTVVHEREDRFGVCAGGRRLAALKWLAKHGRIARDFPVPCKIKPEEEAAEISLAENVQRVAMNAMDEVEAFAGLRAGDIAVDDIAKRFGLSVRHVEQRLALAGLSPKIRNAYRKGELTLDVARAFCIAPDHATQERVFRQMGKPITHVQSVRQALTLGRVPVNDRLVKFVGLDVYEKAGGRIVRDLFEDELVLLEDGDVLQRLAGEKLDAIRDELLSEGWGWAEIQHGYAQVEGCAPERLRPSAKKPSARQAKAIAALENEIETIDAELEASEDDEALWDRRDQLEADLGRLTQSLSVWDKALIAHAGASVGIDQSGAVIVTRGLIKRADLKALNKLRQTSAPEPAQNGDEVASPSTAGAALLQVLVEKLTLARTCALRAELVSAPHAALALLAFSLLQRSGGDSGLAGLDLRNAPYALNDHAAFNAARSALQRGAPQSLSKCMAQPVEVLLSWLALLVAETLQLTHRGANTQDAQLQMSADDIASLIDLDMRQYWRADESFWLQTPKAFALEALAGAPKYCAMAERPRKAALASLSKRKKAELAKIAAAEFEQSGRLPDLLSTPPRAGDLTITAEGKRALNAAA